MKAERLGFLSVIVASSCCTVPLGLALVGLGGLGLSSVIGAYRWYLTAGAVALLAAAWGYFLREKIRIERLASELKNERSTRASLTFASVIVGFFVALHVYAALGASAPAGPAAAVASETLTLPVRGMSCVTCEWPIESILKKLDGVLEADASAARSSITVKARPGTVSLDVIAAAVRAVGYEPDLAAVKGGG